MTGLIITGGSINCAFAGAFLKNREFDMVIDVYKRQVPDSAVCNEAVKLAQKRKFTGLKGFVNGVLRGISRNKEQLKWPDDSVRYSMPSWILDMWKDTYGEETTVSMACLLYTSRCV